jgi:hypothetical protein
VTRRRPVDRGPTGGRAADRGPAGRRPTGRRRARELGLLLVGAAVAAGALWLAFRAGSYRAHLGLCLAGGFAVAACWRLAVAVAQPGPEVLVPGDRPAPDDGLIALASLEHRLSWGSVDPDRFRERVRPVLVDLALERLRSRHGIDPATQPEEARRILGESLWQMVTGPPPSRCPTRPELSRMVAELERI